MSEADMIREAIWSLIRNDDRAAEADAILTALERRAEQADVMKAWADDYKAQRDAATARAEQAEAALREIRTVADLNYAEPITFTIADMCDAALAATTPGETHK